MSTTWELPIQYVLGIPVHPLVVHAAVVLLPLTSIGLLLMASAIKRSKRYGGVVVLLSWVAAVATWLAMASGLDLQAQLGHGTSRHFELGQWMPALALALMLVTTLLWLLDRKPATRGRMAKIVAVSGAVIAVAVIVATGYVGYLGAQLTWG